MIETSPNGRTESEIIARTGIPVAMGSATYWLRPLTMDATDEWEVQIRDVLGAMFGKLGKAGGGIDGILGLYRQSVDSQLDALYAYDALGGAPTLPERADLRKTASRDDVDVAIRKLVKHEFPLLKGMDFLSTWVPAEVREIITRQLIRLLPEPVPEAESPLPPSTSGSSMNIQRTGTRLRSGRR